MRGCERPRSRGDSVLVQYSTDSGLCALVLHTNTGCALEQYTQMLVCLTAVAGITWLTLHTLDQSMYWQQPHYDYIELPPAARTQNTRFRWWQQVLASGADVTGAAASWSIDDVYIGGTNINPPYLEERFQGNARAG